MNPGVILLTGSSGFLGRHLGHSLSGEHLVVGFDRPGAPHPPQDVLGIDVDLTSDESVERGLGQVQERHGRRLMSVVHLAAYFDFTGEENPLYERVTVGGTRRLLRSLHRLDFDVEQFIFSSTMLVHAPCEPGETIDESSPLDPRWPYPISKLETEQVIAEERREIPTLILRVSGVYDELCHSIPLAHQIQRIYERRLTSRVFPGHSSHGQSFMHVEDFVDVVRRAVDRRGLLPAETTMLVGEPVPVSYDELQHRLGRLIHDEDWQTAQIPKAVARTGAWMQDALPLMEDPFIKPWMIDFADDHYALDISKARSMLEWVPSHSLLDSLSDMVAALKRDPDEWYRMHDLGTRPMEQMTAESETR